MIVIFASIAACLLLAACWYEWLRRHAELLSPTDPAGYSRADRRAVDALNATGDDVDRGVFPTIPGDGGS